MIGLSYSLPLLAYYYDQANGGGTGPGNPFYVVSTPGAIDSLVVVATGSSGNPVNTNFNYMDDAYPTPSGESGSNFFSTVDTADPGTGPFQGVTEDPNGDLANTWDTDIGSDADAVICARSNEEGGFLYGKNLNNGFEQIFITTASRVVNVPEPATIALLGMGLLGLGLARRRRPAA